MQLILIMLVVEQSRGCLGCCMEAPVSVSMDDPSKRPRTSQGKDSNSTSDHFWSCGTNEMDHSVAPTQSNSEASETSHPESVKPGKFSISNLSKLSFNQA